MIFQNGSGPNSDWVHVDTPLEDKDEGQVAGPPLSLKVQPSVDSIQLSWLPPRDDSVMIRGYLVIFNLLHTVIISISTRIGFGVLFVE